MGTDEFGTDAAAPDVEPPAGSFATDVLHNPAVQTLCLMVLVTTLTWVATFVGRRSLFVLAPPLLSPPWALVTSVYAHDSVGHLVSNALVIGLAGGLVALSTSWVRFHLFVLLTGVASAVSQVAVFYYLGTPIAVLGASGAAFALVGYVLSSNALSAALTSWLQLSLGVVLVAATVVAAALTVELSPPGSALLAHFVGAVLGLVAGHFRLLHVSE